MYTMEMWKKSNGIFSQGSFPRTVHDDFDDDVENLSSTLSVANLADLPAAGWYGPHPYEPSGPQQKLAVNCCRMHLPVYLNDYGRTAAGATNNTTTTTIINVHHHHRPRIYSGRAHSVDHSYPEVRFYLTISDLSPSSCSLAAIVMFQFGD